MKSTTYPNANPRDGFKRVQANNNCCTFQTEMVSLSLNFPYERQIFNLLNQLSIISVISTLQPSLNCISVIKESPYLKFSCESNSIDLSSVFPLSRRIQSNLFNSLYDRCYISTISNLHVLYGKISSISISYQLDI